MMMPDTWPSRIYCHQYEVPVQVAYSMVGVYCVERDQCDCRRDTASSQRGARSIDIERRARRNQSGSQSRQSDAPSLQSRLLILRNQGYTSSLVSLTRMFIFLVYHLRNLISLDSPHGDSPARRSRAFQRQGWSNITPFGQLRAPPIRLHLILRSSNPPNFGEQ